MKSKFLIVVSIVAAAGLATAQGGGGGRGGFGGQMGRGGGGITGLLNRADVQGELKITDDQKTKLTEMRVIRGQRGQGGQGGQGGGQGGQRGQGGQGGQGGGQGGQVDADAMRKAMEEREKNALAVLDAGQQKRLKELYVQRSGNRSVLNSTIQADLGLSDDQKKKIAELQTKQQEANRAIFEKAQAGEIQREEIQALREKNDKILDEEIGKVLTADQVAKLKGMNGAPFKFDDGGGR
jgi:hypothetical protein